MTDAGRNWAIAGLVILANVIGIVVGAIIW